jgi:cephalosporin hydroxylase
VKDSRKVGGDKEFETRNKKFTDIMSKDKSFTKKSLSWFAKAFEYEYLYHFRWLGLPIIQFPSDVLALQEIIWKLKPDIIIETGIARGGSLIFHASILELIGKGNIIGVDIEIRPHNRSAIEKHPLFKRIKLFEGSSTDQKIVNKIKNLVKNKKSVLVILDSNHTHEHVLKELELYSPFVKKNSYLIVFDTILEYLPKKAHANRPWGKGNNPKTAVFEFLKKNKRFKIDYDIPKKLSITSSPDGFLKCMKN